MTDIEVRLTDQQLPGLLWRRVRSRNTCQMFPLLHHLNVSASFLRTLKFSSPSLAFAKVICLSGDSGVCYYEQQTIHCFSSLKGCADISTICALGLGAGNGCSWVFLNTSAWPTELQPTPMTCGQLHQPYKLFLTNCMMGGGFFTKWKALLKSVFGSLGVILLYSLHCKMSGDW